MTFLVTAMIALSLVESNCFYVSLRETQSKILSEHPQSTSQKCKWEKDGLEKNTFKGFARVFSSVQHFFLS